MSITATSAPMSPARSQPRGKSAIGDQAAQARSLLHQQQPVGAHAKFDRCRATSARPRPPLSSRSVLGVPPPICGAVPTRLPPL